MCAATGKAASAAPEFRKTAVDTKIAGMVAESRIDELLAAFASGNGAFPECGAYPRFAEPDSPFAKLGIPVGSVLERQRSTRFLAYPFKYELDPATLGDSADKLVWVTPENERRETVVPPGRLGFHFNSYRNMPNWYLRHGQRNPKWDRLVLLALQRQALDQALAESCWAAAVDHGYRPDLLSSWSGMMLALANDEFDRAEAFAEFVVPFESGSSPTDFPITPFDINQLALLTGNPRWFTEAGESLLTDPEYSEHLPNFRHQIELARDVPAVTPPPSVLARDMKRESFLMDADTSPLKGFKNYGHGVSLHEQAAMAHHKGKEDFPEYRFEAGLDHYSNYFFSPAEPVRDIDFEIRFRAEPAPAPRYRPKSYNRVFTVGLADRGPSEVRDIGPRADSRLLVANLSFDSFDMLDLPVWNIGLNAKVRQPFLIVKSGLGRDPGPLLIPTSPPYLHDPKRFHTLRFVRVGAQAEALLDGRRLALVQVPLDRRNPGIFLRVVGCTVTVTSLKADTLR